MINRAFGWTLLAILASFALVGVSAYFVPRVIAQPAALNVSGPVSMTTISGTDAQADIHIDCCTVVSTNATLARTALVGLDKQNPVKIGAQMSGLIQALLDTRIPLSNLPADDPDKTTDPAQCDQFWLTVGGTTYLVGRNIVVNIFWNGDRYQMHLRNPNLAPPC